MNKSRISGFSLMELCIVLALVALVSVWTFAGYSKWYEQHQLEAFKLRLVNALKLAQALSLTQHEALIVCGAKAGICTSNWQGNLVVMTQNRKLVRDLGPVPATLSINYSAFYAKNQLLIQDRGLLVNNGTLTLSVTGKERVKMTLSKQGVIKAL